MWLWQLSLQQWHSNLPERHQFFIRIIAATCCAHLMALFCILFMYKQQCDVLAFSITKSAQMNNANIVIVPWKTSGMNNKPSGSPMGNQAKQEEITVAKAKQPEKTTPKTERESARVQGPVTQLVSAMAKKQKKVEQAKKEKAAQKAERLAKAKKLKEQKKEEERQIKLALQHQRQEAKDVSTPVIKQETKSEISADQSPLYVTQTEFDALQTHKELQEEIQRVWQPPVGLSCDVACLITAVIDWQGKLADAKITQTSGISIYDLSAQEALYAMAFPKSLYGKEITITFNQ